MYYKTKSIRSIINHGNSRVVSLPTNFALLDDYVVIRMLSDLLLITPYSKDEKLVLSKEILLKLDMMKERINKEYEAYKEIHFLRRIYKNYPDKAILDKIKEIEKRLDLFRLSFHDEI